ATDSAAGAGGGSGGDADADAATGADGATPSDRDVRYEHFVPEHSVGKVHGFCGNWLVLLKAYAYVARLGDQGLCDASAKAVLNANYLASQIDYDVPYGPFHHEFVASADRDAADVAKRMLDHGVHPPTTKWPELVDEALMTEPTEAESRRDLDLLAAAFDAVRAEDDETLAAAPERTAAARIDQALAAREPRLSWQAIEDEGDPATRGD
ncbi:MAG: glycine dehydrogenase subunit 2, partial [Halobacteriaceae archaeon]